MPLILTDDRDPEGETSPRDRIAACSSTAHGQSGHRGCDWMSTSSGVTQRGRRERVGGARRPKTQPRTRARSRRELRARAAALHPQGGRARGPRSGQAISCEVPGCRASTGLELCHAAVVSRRWALSARNLVLLCHRHHVMLDAEHIACLGFTAAADRSSDCPTARFSCQSRLVRPGRRRARLQIHAGVEQEIRVESRQCHQQAWRSVRFTLPRKRSSR